MLVIFADALDGLFFTFWWEVELIKGWWVGKHSRNDQTWNIMNGACMRFQIVAWDTMQLILELKVVCSLAAWPCKSGELAGYWPNSSPVTSATVLVLGIMRAAREFAQSAVGFKLKGDHPAIFNLGILKRHPECYGLCIDVTPVPHVVIRFVPRWLNLWLIQGAMLG